MKTMTYVDALNTVIATGIADEAVAERITALRDSLVKRASAPHSDKPTKTQIENEGIKNEILAHLSADTVTITDIHNMMPTYSTQKISALVSQLVKANKVVRAEVKGKAYFCLPTEGDAE